MIERTFFFDATGTCRDSKLNIDARCVYFDDRHKITALEFFDELVSALKASDTLPDCMVVIASADQAKKLQDYWLYETVQKNVFVQRGARKEIQYIKSYYFFSWSPESITELYVESINNQPFSIPIETFIEQGLQYLIRKNDVVQIAPAGHMFKHPSGTINKIFIQARELAKTEPQLCFVGRAIYSAMQKDVFTKLTIVFIDTMSIYHYVREALSFAGSTARIHSFHSYHEVKELTTPSDAYLVIISASTSGGMARSLEKDQGFDGKRLLTIVDMSTHERSGKVLVSLAAVNRLYPKLLVDGSETEIELVGEHFSSKAKPPRAVTVGEPHTPKNLIKLLRNFGIDGFKEVNHAVGAAKSRVVCLSPSEHHFKGESFSNWLKDEILWSVSLAIDHIIYTDDAASEQIAQKSAQIIKTAKGASNEPTIIAYKNLDAKKLENAHGVLIVAAVVGDGGTLREISRDLREYIAPSLPRHFLIGVGLPQTIEAWNRLLQFLERNSTHRRYGFSAWLVLPVGPDHADNTWKCLSNLSAQAELSLPDGIEAVEKSVVEESLKKLSEVIHASYHGFLPRTDGSDLSLSDGFLFFGDVFKDKLSSVSNSVVYLAVTSVLQSARDINTAGNQLKPTGYESVVLSPECFLRYNDNLLQACFLRACHPSELDYSTCPHLSKLMKELLSKIFARHEHSYGAASMEFAAALATGRLKLKKVDFEAVVTLAIEHLKLTPSALLGFLLICKLQLK